MQADPVTPTHCAACAAPVPALPLGWKVIATGDLGPLAAVCPACVRAVALVVAAMKAARASAGTRRW